MNYATTHKLFIILSWRTKEHRTTKTVTGVSLPFKGSIGDNAQVGLAGSFGILPSTAAKPAVDQLLGVSLQPRKQLIQALDLDNLRLRVMALQGADEHKSINASVGQVCHRTKQLHEELVQRC